jgi:two-component system, LytTR family, sensor histidine kinase AlgZ
MTKASNKWAFALLWINLAVAVVILIENAAGRFGSLRDLLRTATYALVYANLTGLFGTLVLGAIAERLTRRGVSLRLVVPVGIVVFTALGGLLAQALLMQLGLVIPEHFWPEYLNNLRVATPLGLVFGFGAFVHASLRNRVEIMERKLHEQQLTEERTRKLAAEARLRSLEARVHPHFLFNTLNSISALIPVNPEHAEQLVGRLAVLLRASLDSGRQPLIPLRDELTMVESYMAIERARLGDKLRSSVEVQAEAQDRLVPPMSVQSLVENAVKHGIMARGEGGDILVKAVVDGASLRVEVRDTGPGFDLTAVPAGRGLDNLVERLRALFGDSAGLRVFRRDDHTLVEMALPVR